MRMILRLTLCVVFACSLIACSSPQKKKDRITAAKAQEKAEKSQEMENDPDFQAFVGRLRKAVAQHDVDTIAPMMTSNFGYSLNPVGEGPGVFQYWDQQNVWPHLQQVLDQHFALKDNFMVAPAAFSTDPNFHGYRAGLTIVDGSWKFAYFVTD
jgi:hypothetical protein